MSASAEARSVAPVAERQSIQHVVQYLRAAAASLVVFHHVEFQIALSGERASMLAPFAKIGACGVDVFFVISGFIIFYTMSAERGPAAAAVFGRHRAARVLPLYWVWTSVIVLLAASGAAFRSYVVDLPWLLSSYSLVPYEHAPGQVHPILDQGWTLSFELYFYALAAIAILLFPLSWRLPALAVALAAVQQVVGRSGLPFPIRDWLGSPLVYEFLFGAGIAVVFRHPRFRDLSGRHRTAGLGLVVIGFAALLGTAFVPDAEGRRLFVWGVPSAAIVVGAVLANRPPASLAGRLLYALGTASYSLYLTHGILAAILGTVMKQGRLAAVHADLVLVIGTVLIVAVASLSYPAVEKPLLRLFRRKRRPPYATTPAPA